MIINLKEGERLDDLQRNGYKIIQKKGAFCFGIDAVLLSDFSEVRENETVLDMGTGTGIIPILLAAKTKGKNFIALEIQPEMAEMASRSIELNNLGSRIKVVSGDIKEASVLFGRASFDVVTTNPPYMNYKHGLVNPKAAKAIARHEILCNLEDIIGEAAKVLKQRGRFYMVHRPQRITEIIEMMRKYKLEPKRIRSVHSYADKEASMVLIEAHKGGGTMMKLEAPLIIYKEQGIYTDEIHEIYRR